MKYTWTFNEKTPSIAVRVWEEDSSMPVAARDVLLEEVKDLSDIEAIAVQLEAEVLLGREAQAEAEAIRIKAVAEAQEKVKALGEPITVHDKADIPSEKVEKVQASLKSAAISE